MSGEGAAGEGSAGPHPARNRRLFFALWPVEDGRDALAAETRRAVEASGGRPVLPASYHLTLVFLGSVAEDRLPEVRAAGAAAADAARRPGGPFVMVTLDGIEYWRGPGVLCATASRHAPGAADLAGQLRSRLRAAGFSPDLKPFRPHVTLARKVSRATAEPVKLSIVWTFRSFALVESVTHASGPVYSVIDSWDLCGA